MWNRRRRARPRSHRERAPAAPFEPGTPPESAPLGTAVARSEQGSVAAELALALPAVVLTLLLGAGALGAAARQVVLQDAVADAARLLGRGESITAANGVVSAAVEGANISHRESDDLVCVTAQIDVAIGHLLRTPLSASSCALSGGR